MIKKRKPGFLNEIYQHRPLMSEYIETRQQENEPLLKTFIKTLAQGFDPKPTELEKLSIDYLFATRLMVKNKAGKLVPFVLNKAQYHYLQHQTGRDIIVKARQLGFSTLLQAQLYERVLRSKTSVSGVTVANEGDNTSHLVDIFNGFHDNYNIPQEKPERKGRYPNGIRFLDNGSIVYMGTANNPQFGRSKTINILHASEIGYWRHPRDIMLGLLESIPTSPDVIITLESTANGASGYYFEEVQSALKGENNWKVHFYAWWWANEYKLPLDRKETLKYTAEEQLLIRKIEKEQHITLTPEQIKWRRDKQNTLKREFQQEYPESIEQAFLTSGRTYFNLGAIQQRELSQAKEPVFQDYPIGGYYQLRVYEPAIEGVEYVIGADTAEGISVSTSETDYSAAIVRDKRRNVQVATIHGKFPPLEFAKILQDVGNYYNNALIGIERNNHGHAVIALLLNGTSDGIIKPYPNLFEALDGKLGWLTNRQTKPIMLSDLRIEYDQPRVYHISDKRILAEARTFVINDQGYLGASPGSHDDLTDADAIAGQMRHAGEVEREVIYKPISLENT